jgi:8-oxo-dGTP pyrophosphatase MutT (NUDIX family)
LANTKTSTTKINNDIINGQEPLDIVDPNDKVIGQNTKENKFNKELISRNVAIFLIDEDYMTAAKREVKEELGVSCKLRLLDKIYNEFEEVNLKSKF